MEKEAEIFIKKVRELGKRSYERGIYTYSHFLDMYQQDLFHTIESEFRYVSWHLEGGYPMAERVLVVFGDEESIGYQESLPIAGIRIAPHAPKFADKLNHRDYLGALMNLGIERELLGDIQVNENEAYLYCLSHIEELIQEQLTKVKHTLVSCTSLDQNYMVESKYMEVSGFAASSRLDAVIGLAFPVSRSQSIPYIQGKKVFVNGRLITSNSYLLKDKDVVSVRGFGKFRYEGADSQSKKGRSHILIHRFI